MKKSLSDRFWSKVNIKGTNECWNWTASVRNKKEGYGAFWHKGRHHPSHRIAIFLLCNHLELVLCVCHRCDNPSCCNPNHLFTGTSQENNEDKVRKGRGANGISNPRSKLTKENVIEARKLEGKAKRVDIAKKLGVTIHVINDLFLGRTWRHL